MFGVRLGRNARYASIGNGLGAALMGACGYYVSNQAVFYLTAALTLPALAALLALSGVDAPVRREARRLARSGRERSLLRVLRDRRLLTFAGCAMLFTLANAAMLPLASTALTKRAGGEASLLIAACIVLPQLMVALLSPRFGWLAEATRAPAGAAAGLCHAAAPGRAVRAAHQPGGDGALGEPGAAGGWCRPSTASPARPSASWCRW